jgi:hypothetical protein
VAADNLTAICEPTVYIMWEPQRLTTLWASTACYRDSFFYLHNRRGFMIMCCYLTVCVCYDLTTQQLSHNYIGASVCSNLCHLKDKDAT